MGFLELFELPAVRQLALVGLVILVADAFFVWAAIAMGRRAEKTINYCECPRFYPGHCDPDCPGPKRGGYDPRKRSRDVK